MRKLLLSDDGHPVEAAALSRRHELGIEVQAFYDPALLEHDPRAVEAHLDALRGITDRASTPGRPGDMDTRAWQQDRLRAPA